MLYRRRSTSSVWNNKEPSTVAAARLAWQHRALLRVSVAPLVVGSLAVSYFGIRRSTTRREQQLEVVLAQRTEALRQNELALERRHRVAEGMRDVMAAQNSNQPLASVLLLIATQSVELLGAFAVAIVKTDERSETASVQAFCGTQAGMDSGPAITVPYHTIRRAILSGQSAIILDPGDSPGQNKPAWASAVGPGVVLLAPIVVEAADFRGALLLHYTNRLSVTQAEIELVLLLVAQIVLSIEHAQLTAAALELATTNERQRVARELHDSVTQSLYSIILNSDATLLALQAGKPEKAELRLYQLKDIAREAMTELRLLIYELRPSNLEEQGLLAALQERLEVVETRSGVSVDLQIECDQILPMDVQNELFRVILEGLNNVIKHARAKRVKVMLVRHNDGCRLTIEDDGCGFDVNAARRYGGYGLKTMSERVQCIGGTLSVHSEPGAGATLEICIPV